MRLLVACALTTESPWAQHRIHGGRRPLHLERARGAGKPRRPPAAGRPSSFANSSSVTVGAPPGSLATVACHTCTGDAVHGWSPAAVSAMLRRIPMPRRRSARAPSGRARQRHAGGVTERGRSRVRVCARGAESPAGTMIASIAATISSAAEVAGQQPAPGSRRRGKPRRATGRRRARAPHRAASRALR